MSITLEVSIFNSVLLTRYRAIATGVLEIAFNFLVELVSFACPSYLLFLCWTMKACVCVLCKCVCVCVCVYLIDEKASLLIPCHKTNGPGSQNTFLTQKKKEIKLK